ncbi:MAG TPA: transposase, partial [Longimicrobiales bacterium]|nr:transposase [Longimicrobiales bacterium]
LWREGPLQLSLFDDQDLAEITSAEDFPDERLIACRNPLLARDRARKRTELLQVTEEKLQAVVDATRRPNRPLRGQDKIGVRVGRVLARSKVGKHFTYEITEDGFTFERDQTSIDDEAALDGIYVLRTSVSAEEMDSEDVVRAYKRLSEVERAFRISKDFSLEVEPIYHRLEDRVRAHIFLCMLALYVRIHMERALAPILFTDHDPAGAEAKRASIVAPAPLSDAALSKKRLKKTEDGFPVQSFRSLLGGLATLTKNTIRMQDSDITFEQYARPTPLQDKALDLLDVSYRL